MKRISQKVSALSGRPGRPGLPHSRYLVTGLTGLMFVICYLTYQLTARTLILCLFGSALIVAARIDWRYTYVPDSISVFLVILAVLLHLSRQAPPLADCMIGSLLVAGIMLLITCMTKGGIGGGDIKLFAAAGLLLGIKGNLLAFFLGYVLASLYCIPLLLTGKLTRGSEVPMVPFFAVSMMIAALWGERVIFWYLSLLP